MTALSFTQEHIELIARGKKTQTRRLMKPGERLGEYFYKINPRPPHQGWWELGPAVFSPSGRVKWYVGAQRMVKPGRTARGLFRVEITNIWHAWLHDISEEDAIAEGVEVEGSFSGLGSMSDPPEWVWAKDPVALFADLWDSIHPKKGERFEDNPEVWVLEFTGVF